MRSPCLVTSWIWFAIIKRILKRPARGGPVQIDATCHLLANSPRERDAFSTALRVGALHATKMIFAFLKKTDGNGMLRVGDLRLPPIKIDPKVGAARATTETRALSVSHFYSPYQLSDISGGNWSICPRHDCARPLQMHDSTSSKGGGK